MRDKIHKILNQMEECIVDLKIELCDNDFDTALARKRKEELKETRARGGKARAEKLSPERRSEIARNAVNARWIKESVKRGLRDATEGKISKIDLENL